jgi:GH24 family phage-related lysozyme (muramidase)
MLPEDFSLLVNTSTAFKETNMNKTTGEKGLSLIKSFEGLRLDAYICPAGVATIGYGTTKINSQAVKVPSVITESQANDYLKTDVKAFEQSVNSAVSVPVTQNQFDALVSFTYNLGAGNLRSSTLLKKLNAGDYAGAADEFPKWNKAGGKELAGLTRRRNAERDLFLS